MNSISSKLFYRQSIDDERSKKTMQGTGKCQSLFVRELEAILQVHGSKIGNDLITKVDMHPQKVNRLKQPLQVMGW